MTPARQPHSQRCEKIADRNDIIAFMKFAGFDVELAERTDGVQELTITGFDDTGDTYMLEFASITPTGENHCDKCDHWDMCEGCPYTDERATHTSAPAPAHCMCVECSFTARSSKSCRHTLAGEDKRKIVKAAREQVLDALRKEISDRFHLKPRPYDPNDQEIPQIGIDELAEIFDAAEESLRSQQQEGGR